jgi:ubiquinone/menaquinone biosynthesis C-methylase UbiE
MNNEHFCCPKCQGGLAWSASRVSCASCGADFPVHDGIADFRTSVDDSEKRREWARALELFPPEDTRAFGELLRKYVENTSRPDVLELELRYELDWPVRGRKELSRLRQLLERMQAPALEALLEKTVCLDIGCGKGVMLASLAPLAGHVIGIDYCVDYVLFARALLRERGAKNFSLAVAEGENLPLRDAAVDFVSALDVVEHLADQKQGVRQAYRVLARQGHLFLNSPNRYSMLAPEDHCQLWFVGVVPYRWQKQYVRWLSGHSYKNVRLLSYRAVKSMMRTQAQRMCEAAVMVDIDSAGLSLKERLLARIPPLRWMLNTAPLKYVAPSFHFLATK